ncbi:glycoside hydrolase family 2 protein [Periconia macrospinosa]|uniref:Glycoside hydrolase family 2 protein n=1 Tax=Periconia macrospinosa TaxID=97972 RepID=A0A2V1DAE3_9PLEO|nr:glycoside hydrolase family 2 protein [Periconia macrospinosa]
MQNYLSVFVHPDTKTAAHEQGIRELISRDKNHSCVVMWSIVNEPGSHENGAREYFEPLVSITRELDSRPVSFAYFSLATSEKDQISDIFDVLCLNRYYGWYENCRYLTLVETEVEKDLRGWQDKYGKPKIIIEYKHQSYILEIYHLVLDRLERVVGEHVWTFADFQTSQLVFCVDGNKKGVFTRARRPKAAAQVLRNRWRLEGEGA